MGGAARVQGWLEAGVLLAPAIREPSFVDLVRALAAVSGVPETPDLKLSAHARAIAARIGTPEHLVFALVDGFGVNLLEALPAGSFLRTHQAGELRAIFPSTTAAAITTLATGAWPKDHAVPGWWAHLEEAGTTVTILPFHTRYESTPLLQLGLTPEALFPLPSWLPRARRDVCTLQPAGITGTPYSRYFNGATPAAGYESIADAVDLTIRRVLEAPAPAYTYLYLPQLDATCHRRGVDHAEVRALRELLDYELERLAQALAGRGRLVVSADHGHINVPADRNFNLAPEDPLLELLSFPPTVEPRVPVFHVAPARGEEFARRFEERFGAHFALLATAEAEALELFGPGRLSPRARPRFGDFWGISDTAVTLKFKPAGAKTGPEHLGSHAGLLPGEMRIPLILA